MPVNLPYPLQFDQSQMKNPYTKYANRAIPWYGLTIDSSGTFGNQVPTDAYGQGIQSYVDANNTAQANYQQQQTDYQKALADYNAGGGGSTQGDAVSNTGAGGISQAQQSALGQWGPAINELMNNYATAQAAKSPQQQAIDAQNTAMRNSMPSGVTQSGGFGQSSEGAFPMGGSSTINYGPIAAAPVAAAPAAPKPPTPPNMTQAYIAALQSPGHVTTPGANVAESAPPSTQSNVLQQFLANWQQGGSPTTGAGNYNNKSIFDAWQGNV